MATNEPEKPHEPAGFQSMLARLRGMVHALKSPDEAAAKDELLPTWDSAQASSSGSEPVPREAALVPEAIPCAVPADSSEYGTAEPYVPPSIDSASMDSNNDRAPPEQATSPPATCPHCQARRQTEARYCGDCGFVFPPPQAAQMEPPSRVTRIKDRYEIDRPYDERDNVSRFFGLDHGDGDAPARRIALVRQSAGGR